MSAGGRAWRHTLIFIPLSVQAERLRRVSVTIVVRLWRIIYRTAPERVIASHSRLWNPLICDAGEETKRASLCERGIHRPGSDHATLFLARLLLLLLLLLLQGGRSGGRHQES